MAAEGEDDLETGDESNVPPEKVSRRGGRRSLFIALGATVLLALGLLSAQNWQSEDEVLRPLGTGRRHDRRAKRFAKLYIAQHKATYRLGHLVRMHDAGFHSVASSLVKRFLKSKKKKPTEVEKQREAQAEAAKALEAARERGARKLYGWLCWRVMVPVWTGCLAALATWMGLMLEERTLPAIKALCAAAEIPDDVAGATILALATGGFEVLFSAVETLEGQVGVGLDFVLGTGVVNFGLILPVVCAASTAVPIELSLGSVLRDGGFALLAFLALLVVVADGQVNLAESLSLLALYACHVAACFLLGSGKQQQRCLKPPPPRKDSLLPNDDDDDDDETTGDDDTSKRRRFVTWAAEAEEPDIKANGDLDHFVRLADDADEPPSLENNDDNSGCCCGMFSKPQRRRKAEVPATPGKTTKHRHDWKSTVLWWSRALFPPAPRITPPTGRRKLHRIMTALKGVALTLLGSALWLVVLLLVLTRLADLFALSARFPLGFAASVFLPAVYAVPDALVAATVARQGQAKAAVANALGVQVVTVLLGVGLPFALANLRAGGTVKVLGSDSDAALRWGVFFLGSLFVGLVLTPYVLSLFDRRRRPQVAPLFTRHNAATLLIVYFVITVFVTLRTTA